ncbi:MAG: hypothetical protein JO085_09245, partial [Acidimicrobiia bacterium]|nr:hypothetical protein [Acidimicrobiia bacterium]
MVPASPGIAGRYAPGSVGYDISWPQCDQSLPGGAFAIAVVGVTNGTAFTLNPCLAREAEWAGNRLQLYMNINSPTDADRTSLEGPIRPCQPTNDGCMAYNYGYTDALDAVVQARRHHAHSQVWWHDVETNGGCTSSFPTGSTGYWSC